MWTHFWEVMWELVGFSLKGLVLVMLIAILVAVVRSLKEDDDDEGKGHLIVRHLNEELRLKERHFKSALVPESSRGMAEKAFKRQEKKRRKAERKQAKRTLKEQQRAATLDDALIEEPTLDEQALQEAEEKADEALEEDATHDIGRTRSAETGKVLLTDRPRLFILDFKGDVQASAVEGLRQEVSAILGVASVRDRVLLRLENSGGYVHTHGLAASQLKRLTDAGVELWVSVDAVAASGGYLMACVAHRIIAAPFSIIGSIGVVAQLPNVNRLLKRFDVDVELHTAGKHKRTLTTLGENTEEGRAKFIEDLQVTHDLFKSFVSEARPSLDIEQVATGETWLGTNALSAGLIDELKTSDELIMSQVNDFEVYTVHHHTKRKLTERFMSAAHNLLSGQLLG